MSCKKPSGNPQAIYNAAAAIDSYANGVGNIFSSIQNGGSVSLAAGWVGEAANSVEEVLNEYRGQLGDYSIQLHDYASQLRDYARKLEKAQSCSLTEILTWIFLILFAIVEIVIGLFFGGVISGALTALFGAVLETVMQVVATAGRLIVSAVVRAVESSATLARIVTNFARAGAELGRGLALETGTELGLGAIQRGGTAAIRTGINTVEVGGQASSRRWVVYFAVDGLSSGRTGIGEGAGAGATGLADVGGSGARSALTTAIEQGGAKALSLAMEFPQWAYEQTAQFTWAAFYNTAEWYMQELVIRGIASMDPDSPGFTHMWDGDTEQTEAISIFAGMLVGSFGYVASKGLLSLANKALLATGIDVGAKLASTMKAFSAFTGAVRRGGDDVATEAGRLLKATGGEGMNAAAIRKLETLSGTSAAARKTAFGELGEAVEKTSGQKVAKEVFEDVLENAWDYGAILALYPFIGGEDFDWKEWGWYVSYGIVEGLLHAPLKHAAGSITKKHLGDIFPENPGFSKEHPAMSLAAKNLGDYFIVNGLSILRKVAFDPLADIEGSFNEYLKHIHEAPELEEQKFENAGAEK